MTVFFGSKILWVIAIMIAYGPDDFNSDQGCSLKIDRNRPEIRDAHTRTVVLAPYSRTLRAEYKEYGVRRVLYSRGTKFSTGYDHYFQNGAQRVRSTKGTVLRVTNFSTEYDRFCQHGARGVRSTKGTVLRRYEL